MKLISRHNMAMAIIIRASMCMFSVGLIINKIAKAAKDQTSGARHV